MTKVGWPVRVAIYLEGFQSLVVFPVRYQLISVGRLSWRRKLRLVILKAQVRKHTFCSIVCG